MASPREQPQWSDLPSDLLGCIMERLDILSTYCFLRVCTSWAAAATKSSPHLLSGQPVLFMSLPFYEAAAGGGGDDWCTFAHDIFVGGSCRVVMPALQDRYWVSSRDGWLVTMDEHRRPELLNPVTGARIGVPSLATVADDVDECKKIILCKAPRRGTDWLAVGIFSCNQLAFVGPGDEQWTELWAPAADEHSSLEDAIYYRGKVFAVSTSGSVYSWDLHTPALFPEEVTQLPLDMEVGLTSRRRLDLAESANGHLLVACTCCSPRRSPSQSYEVEGVKLYELDVDSGQWSRVRSLGDRSLFLGANYPFFVRAPEAKGVKANCVYFTDQFLGPCLWRNTLGRYDYSVFDLGEESFEKTLLVHRAPQLPWPTTIWFRPAGLRVERR